MAEIRKHETSASGLAAAVRAAIGGDVRPVTPGAQANPGEPVKEPDGADAVVGQSWFLTSGAERFLVPPDNAG